METSWSDRLSRMHEQHYEGDIFKTDDLRAICQEIAKNPETTVSSVEYLRLIMLLIQRHESHRDLLVGLPIETIEALVSLLRQTEPANADVVLMRTA